MSDNKMETHVTVISALWIVSGALGLIFAFLVFWLFLGISFIPDLSHESPNVPYILRGVAIWGGGLIAILSIPEIIAGIGLMKKRELGRILALVMSFLNLIWFPLGTALGIYSIVILIKEETIQLFQA
jgi:hypothetical protein